MAKKTPKKESSKKKRTRGGSGAEDSQLVLTTDGTHPVDKPSDYHRVLANLKQMIGASRKRAIATVNRELVLLYWQIGSVIVQQQEKARWGDAVVKQLAADLRSAFPDLKGLTRDNLFRMRQFVITYREIDEWLIASGVTQAGEEPPLTASDEKVEALTRQSASEKVGPAPRQSEIPKQRPEKVGTVCRQTERNGADEKVATVSRLLPKEGLGEIVATLSRHLQSPELAEPILNFSWSHHKEIIALQWPDERYFYLQMGIRERWSVRELRRQIDSDLFTRYVSVREHPEKCLPDEAEAGELLPFKDHYVLEFLGLQEEHSEQELRRAILANLRDFFLEFGRDLTFVGEEYPLTVGNDTFSIDLLFFHRRLQCLIAVDLKKGKFKPEYVGKCQFYCAALDEQIKLAHEKPSIGLVLCRSADRVQVRLALTAAAEKIGVATYQTALPDPKLIRQRLKQLPHPSPVQQRGQARSQPE